MKNSTFQQYNYHRWANNRFFEHLAELPAEIYDKEIKSVFSSIAEVIKHIYQVDALWLSVMSGDTFEETMAKIEQIQKQSAGKSLEQMQHLYRELENQYQNFFNKLDDPDAIISIEHPQYGKLKTAVSALIQHVVNHGSYHRGNITAMLRQQAQAGVPTDYIIYLYEKK